MDRDSPASEIQAAYNISYGLCVCILASNIHCFFIIPHTFTLCSLI